jgi:DUF1680 family protein
MNKINAEERIKEDIEKIYLGNLNTVEFDLVLPDKGKNGSEISWTSDDERFLDAKGIVTRPRNGTGDRNVNLHALFRYEGLETEKIYNVRILEKPNLVQIISVFPLVRNARKDIKYDFPQAVVVKAVDGKFFSYPVIWEEGNNATFTQCGEYCVKGKVKNHQLEAFLFLKVTDEEAAIGSVPETMADALDTSETKLLPGSVFYHLSESQRDYLLSIDVDQLLYNFRRTAELDTGGAQEMTGWDSPESQLRGHTTGHFLSAFALCWRETDDKRILDKLNALVCGLGECQEAFAKLPKYSSGYLGGYSEEQFDLLEKETPYPIIWAPYYTLHKIIAGLLDCYYCAENKKALDIAAEAGLWVYRRLSALEKAKRESMWDIYIAGEFGGMNETMARLYQIKGDNRFLECAEMFNNDHLLVPMEEKKDTLGGMHANQHIPQIVGILEMYRAAGERRYYEIAEFFWKTITEHHTYVNGGTGENEMFWGIDCIGERLTKDTTELCATYNMLKLTRELFRFSPQSFYMDYYERAVVNHVAASFDDEPTGESAYFYPLKPGCRREFLYENSCCHGTGLESQMKYGENIYWESGDSIYVNLFIPSEVEIKSKNLKIIQQSEETDPGKILLKVKGKSDCILKIRKPYWCEGAYQVCINGSFILAECGDDGYIYLQKNWSEDEIEIRFPCTTRVERTTDKNNIAALAYGPFILAALEDNKEFMNMPLKNAAEAVINKDNGNLKITTMTDSGENITWIPLYKIKKQRHHVYWKVK